MFSPFPPRFLIPNAITALSLILACVAIALAHQGEFSAAAWSIVWCVLLDRIDGAVARLVNASSEFGRQLDSLADFLAFCVAPGLIVYFFFTGSTQYAPLVGKTTFHAGVAISALLFVVAGGVRLARFNVTAARSDGAWFEGLSTTFAGFILVTLLLCGERYAWPPDVMAWMPLVLLVCSLLMVSNLPLPKELPSGRRVLFIVVVVGHLLVYALGMLRMYPGVLLFLALSYPALGFVLGARWSRRADDPAYPGEESPVQRRPEANP